MISIPRNKKRKVASILFRKKASPVKKRLSRPAATSQPKTEVAPSKKKQAPVRKMIVQRPPPVMLASPRLPGVHAPSFPTPPASVKAESMTQASVVVSNADDDVQPESTNTTPAYQSACQSMFAMLHEVELVFLNGLRRTADQSRIDWVAGLEEVRKAAHKDTKRYFEE